MLDIETLGTRPGSTILSIGACRFDMDSRDTFHAVISRQSCADAGLTEDQDTVDWWGKQTPAAQATLREATSTRATLGSVMHAFRDWVVQQGDAEVWGNGADFDQPILAEAGRRAGFGAPPWKYSAVRCYRTLKALRPDIKIVRQGEHHHALDDARSQGEHALRLLDSLSTPAQITAAVRPIPDAGRV